MSILPDILEVARGYGLREAPKPTDKGEYLFGCPFCGDTKFHLYINPDKKTFNCKRCPARGGVSQFVADVEGRNPEDVIQEWREKSLNGKQKKSNVHPALELSETQWKAIGFTTKPSMELAKHDKQAFNDLLKWAWSEWKVYKRQVLLKVVGAIAVSEALYGSQDKAQEWCLQVERESRVRNVWNEASDLYKRRSTDNAVQDAIKEAFATMPRRKWSYASLEKYEQCPWRFYSRYLLGKEEKQTSAMVIGREVREQIYRNENGLNPNPFCTVEADTMASKALELISKRKNREVRREVVVAITDTDDFHSFIDLVLKDDDQTSILEWKTGWNKFTVEQRPHRLGLNAWALRQLGEQVDIVSYVFLRFKKLIPFLKTDETFEEQAVAWAKHIIQSVKEREMLVQKGEAPEAVFAPLPGKGCTDCGFRDSCPYTAQIKETINA